MATKTKERPIIFSGGMVKAILEGRKTMTRRVVKPQPPEGYSILPDTNGGWYSMRTNAVSHFPVAVSDVPCPFGTGRRLWVREAFALSVRDPDGPPPEDDHDHINWDAIYKEGDDGHNWTDKEGRPVPPPWRSPIHMPRWASRITLEVTGVRVERLQEITEKDALAEGAHPGGFASRRTVPFFQQLWDSINGKKHLWASNPWVWVVEFKVV